MSIGTLIALHGELEYLTDNQVEIHKSLYVCRLARANEKEYRRIIEDTQGLIVRLRNYRIRFGSCALHRRISERCNSLLLDASNDLAESVSVHEQ